MESLETSLTKKNNNKRREEKIVKTKRRYQVLLNGLQKGTSKNKEPIALKSRLFNVRV